MTLRPTQPFGRRGLAPAPHRSSVLRPAAKDTFTSSAPGGLQAKTKRNASASPAISVKAIPQELLATIVAPELQELLTIAGPEPQAAPLKVARSWRAAWLAGLIVGLLHTGTGLASLAMGHNTGGQDAAGLTAAWMGPHLSALIGKEADMQPGLAVAGTTILPLLVLGSLLSGARASVFSLFIAHRILGVLAQTSPRAYALAGAVTALAYTFLMHLSGLDDTRPDWLLEAGTGMAAGCFYRLFAGTMRS